jgi:hypothetical protein
MSCEFLGLKSIHEDRVLGAEELAFVRLHLYSRVPETMEFLLGYMILADCTIVGIQSSNLHSRIKVGSNFTICHKRSNCYVTQSFGSY